MVSESLTRGIAFRWFTFLLSVIGPGGRLCNSLGERLIDELRNQVDERDQDQSPNFQGYQISDSGRCSVRYKLVTLMINM